MCLAIPARVLAIDGMNARVDFDGAERNVLMDLLPDLRAGDYVLVHAGFVIQRLDKVEAQETIALFEEISEAAARAKPWEDK